MYQLNKVPIQNGINFRDLGGIRTEEGRAIKSGKLFRSGSFHLLNEDEVNALSGKIEFILDYRDASEVNSAPDKIWKQANYIHQPANPDYFAITAATSEDREDIQKYLSKLIKETSADHFMLTLYEHLPFNNAGYKQLLKRILENQGPSLVQHCAIGKDRTGVGVMVILSILGVPESTIIEDYLATNDGLKEYREQLLNRLSKHLNEDELESRKVIFTAKEAFITKALSEIKKQYNSVNNWLESDYGIGAKERSLIQSYYLD